MAPHNVPNEPNRWRRRAVRWVVAAAFAIGALAVGLAYRRYADPERVRAEAEALLQQFAHGRVRVGSATFSLLDGIHLFDVAVASASRDAPPGTESAPEEAETVFSCREVLLSHDPLSALGGRLRIRSVVALEPMCSMVHDPVQGTTNIAGLFQGAPRVDDSAMGALPTVELRNARIRVVYRDADRDRTVEDLALTIRGRPSPRNPGLYDVVWQGGADSAVGGHSQIDLRSGYLRNVRGGLPSLSIETVMLAIEAGYDGAGAWCDLLGLDGRVRARDYNLIGGAGRDATRSATIDLHDASLSIPIQQEERGLAAHQRYLRFEKVDGLVQVTAEAIRAEFTGRFHGGECKVSATIRGAVEKLATLDDVDFDAHLTVTALELPRDAPEAPAEQVRFVRRFERLAKFFADYDPHGVIDVDIAAAKRAGADEPIQVRRVLLTARGGDASSRHFPYRGSQLTGAVEYRPDGVWIRHICGEHDGGVVCVDGRLERPDGCAAAEVTIRGQEIPIDDHLYQGLGKQYRAIQDQLRPQGRLNVEVTLSRPACRGDEPEAWRSETTVRFDDLAASYVGLPYPVNHLAGEFVVEGKRLRIVRMDGDAAKAQVNVTGEVSLAAEESPEMDVTIVADGVEFDDRLLAALPEGVRSNIEALQPRGPFDVRTSLTVDPETRKVLSHWTVTLHGASLRPDQFPVELTDINGSIRIEPTAIILDQVTGRYHGAVISASGWVVRHEEDGNTAPRRALESVPKPLSPTEGECRVRGFSDALLNLAVHCRDLRIDDELRSAAPPKLRGVLSDWAVDGPITVDIDLQRDSTGEQDLTYYATAELDGVSIRHLPFPIPFEDVHGTMNIQKSGVRGIGLRARYGVADVQVDFDAHETEHGEEGTIVLSAANLELDESLRGLWPERLRGAWDRAGLRGSIDVRCNELRYHKSVGDSHPTWSVDGRIDLHQVDLRGTAGLNALSGTLTGFGTLIDRLGGTTLSGRLQLATGHVSDLTLSDINSGWSLVRSTDGTGRLALDELRAAIYEGALTGQVELLLEPDRTDYNLTATVHGMQITPWLQAGRAEGPAPPTSAVNDDSPSEVRGTADAHLYLSGVGGEPLSRRGGGRIEVREGYIYRLPILLAILNVLDMSVPNDEALHELDADFFVLGNRLDFTEIALRGGSLRLVGSGSMSLPDQAVDLRLVNIGTRPWARLPLLADFVEGASREFVELRVTGPASRPTVRAQPLRRLSDELKRLFQKKPPKKIAPAGP